jgi:16S rRNA (guanine527-N7)-methyltransferase
VEASAKKAAFLRQAAIELDMANVAVHEGRVESWLPPQRFAVVVSRAFAQLARFVDSCRHLLLPDGVLAAMKGRDPRAELDALSPGCACAAPIRVHVPLLDAQRHLVLCRPQGRA